MRLLIVGSYRRRLVQEELSHLITVGYLVVNVWRSTCAFTITLPKHTQSQSSELTLITFLMSLALPCSLITVHMGVRLA